MIERPPEQPKESPKQIEEREKMEHLPSYEEVTSIIKEKIGEREFEEIKRVEDEEGLEELVLSVESDGGKDEYYYSRASGGKHISPVIHVVFYDGDMPVGGHNIADFIDGKWLKTK